MKLVTNLRTKKFFQNTRVNLIFAALFPLFLAVVTELSSATGYSGLKNLFGRSFGIFFIDLTLYSAFYFSVWLLVKKSWIAALSVGFVFETFAVVEHYKFDISNSHFTLEDLAVTTNPGDVAQFARIDINFYILLAVISFFLYVFYLAIADVSIKSSTGKRISVGIGILVFTICFLLYEPVFSPVMTFFNVNASTTYNSFSESERYDDNSFIANIFVSVNQLLRTRVNAPENYGENKVEGIMENKDPLQEGAEKPNVVFILCESFADFRRVSPDIVPDDIYEGFDKAAEKSFTGTAVVPTFGGNTVRSEFEMIMGLPVKSLNNNPTPHRLIDTEKSIESFATILKDVGYNTAYLHPFTSTFYDRDEYYPKLGFDTLIFQEGFSVYSESAFVTPPTTVNEDIFASETSENAVTGETKQTVLEDAPGYLHGYISDSSAYDEVIKQMKKTEGSDFIFLTTMQNHQPYTKSGDTELNEYLSLAKASGDAILDFINRIDEYSEPTVVVFVGDHYPFFGSEDNVYDRLGFTSENCDSLYLQTYLVHSNYDLKVSINDRISMFYLPSLVLKSIGIESSFIDTMSALSVNTPIYSCTFEVEQNDKLDTITYDRVLGGHYSIVTPPTTAPTRTNWISEMFNN